MEEVSSSTECSQIVKNHVRICLLWLEAFDLLNPFPCNIKRFHIHVQQLSTGFKSDVDAEVETKPSSSRSAAVRLN